MNRADPRSLSVRDLRAELQQLEESWAETLLRASDDDLDEFASRQRELEEEFDRRQRGEHPSAPTDDQATRRNDDHQVASGSQEAPDAQKNDDESAVARSEDAPAARADDEEPVVSSDTMPGGVARGGAAPEEAVPQT